MTQALTVAYTLIDEANSRDPNRWNGEPLARYQGQAATRWVPRLATSPSEALLIAARAHHLERWVIARSDYPKNRAGYLRWRRDNKTHQALAVEPLLSTAGYDTDVIARVGRLLRREHLGVDRETQTLEDVACLVFIETQLDDLAARLDRPRLIRAVTRTLEKMSAAAADAATELLAGTQYEAMISHSVSGTR